MTTLNDVIKNLYPDKEIKFVIVDENGITLYFTDYTAMKLEVPSGKIAIRFDDFEKRI